MVLLVAAGLLVVVGVVGLVTDVSADIPSTMASTYSGPSGCGSAFSRIDRGTGGLGILCDDAIAARRAGSIAALLLGVVGAVVVFAKRSRSTDTTGDATPPAA
ncbi:hypothetical protein AB0I60_22305 [Actinosynnema sp. NPDC050436]|uniref:hypothetical protein n=1 Tax=Actinosynnema sp. NPDC050436 TaxID=3155659 RepID=UPI0033F408CE